MFRDDQAIYVRVGEAAKAGAPIGASVNIAQVTRTPGEARQVGALFADAGQSFFQPGVVLDERRVPVRAADLERERERERPKSFWDHVGSGVSWTWGKILRGLEWGTEATGNIFEASMRTLYGTMDDGFQLGDLTAPLTASPIWGWTQEEWRENWDKAVKAEASFGQTMWLLTEQALERRGWVEPGESSDVRSHGLSLLDDPTRRGERRTYFSQGAAHWTTGVVDAAWQIFMDPLIVGGKAAVAVKAARRGLTAEDVAQIAARSTDEAVELTEKQQRAFNAMDELARAFETEEAGTIAAAARTRWLRNTTDGGAIAYMLHRAGFDEWGEKIADEATRLAARRDVILAGMGDAGAIERVRRRHALLSVELEKMMTGLDDLDMTPILERVGAKADDVVEEFYTKLNNTSWTKREIEAQMPMIRRELEVLERLEKVGQPVRLARDAATAPRLASGELATVPGRRDIARVAKTVHNGRFLEPVHFITGRHLPGTFTVSDDDAAEVFHAAVVRLKAVLRGMKDETARAGYAERLAALEDRFVTAGIGAAAKAPRTAVVREFDQLVNEVVAKKWGQKPEEVAALFNEARARRLAELRQVSRAYQARKAGDPLVLNTGEGIAVIKDDVPVLRSQLADVVSILDPLRLDRFAKAHWQGGLGGWLHKIEDTGAYQLTKVGLAGLNRLWKFLALLRPGAYFVRAQVDSQARILAMLAALKHAAFAKRGLGNLVWNARKVDSGVAAAYAQRYYLHMSQDVVERKLLSLGVDPRATDLAPLPSKRTKELTEKIDALREQRKGLRFTSAHDPAVAEAKLAEIDAKLANLSERAVKTRARLAAQRQRLVTGMDNWREASRLDSEIVALTDELDEVRNLPVDEITKLREDFQKLEEAIAQVKEVKTGELVRRRQTAMARHIGLNAGFDKSGKWRKAKVTDPYWSNDELARRLDQMDARDSILGLLTSSTRAELDALRRTGNWDYIRGIDKEWEGAYLRVVNREVIRDALGQRVLAGWDDSEIIDWFRNTADGRAYLRDMRAAGAGDAQVIVDRLREHVDTLLPPDTAVRAAAVQGRNVTKLDIEATWGSRASARPLVPGELLEPNWKSKATSLYESIERRYFRWVAELPEDYMARHPFYAARFEQHANNLLARAGVADEKFLSIEQVNALRRKAHILAKRDVHRYMFDTSKQTNAGHFLRFLMPFYGAWEDTMVKWGRIFAEKPQAAAVFWDVVRSPNAAGLVVDENGHLIDAYGNVIDQDGNVVGKAGIWDGYIILPLPDAPLPGGGRLHEWAGASSLRIAKNAANVIFQGDPWVLPGPGPIMAVPANELIVRMFPEWWGTEGEPETFTQQVMRYLLPYGPTSDSMLEQFMPSWARAARDVIEQDGRRVDQVYAQLYMEQLNLERRGLADPLSESERIDLIARRTRNWTLLRLMGTQVPFSFTPQSRLSWYKSEYDRYRREDPATAEERFLADYPEFFDVAISLTANETGLTATDESWNAVQRYRSDIAKNPEFGWFFAGAENLTGGFNQGVYHAQFRNRIGPGTSTTFRSRRDPLEVARDAMVEQGWREYQQVNQAIQLKLEEAGLRSLSAKGAEPLRLLKQQFVADLSARNPDWAADYGAGGSAEARVEEFLNFAVRALRSHKDLQRRGDMLALTEYLEVRGAVREALADRFDPGWRERRLPDGRPAPMPTFSINRQDAADLKAIWDDFTAHLIARDLGFEQMWSRVLEHDDLTANIYLGGE